MRATAQLIVAILVLGMAPAIAGADEAATSQAPYLLVTSSGAKPEGLPLKESTAEVQIAGVMAHVTIRQVYQNRGQIPLEATYVFPGSTRAAVFGMRMKVGAKVTEAKIKKKEAARRIYEAAKEQGKTASLLEQHRPNVFQMNVANILPGDRVEIELHYTELIVPTDGVYEFVYPAVVGPRYAGEQSSGETWHKNSYQSGGAPYRFGLALRIATGVPLQAMTSPSHQVKPNFVSANRANLALGSAKDGDRDFVLRYKLRGNAVETGLLRFEDKDENFFLLMMQPPKRVARDDMPAREYVFIVDVSGSMNGFPLSVSKKLVRNLLTGLRSQDRFNILFFAGSSYQLNRSSVPASRANISRAIRVLDQQRGGGGTNLLSALEKALKMPANRDASRTFIAITDGFVSVDDRAFSTVRNNLGRANFFAFGIGSSVNRNLIEGLARAGMGEPFVVLDANQAPKQARAFRKMIEAPVLTNIKTRFNGFAAYDVVPKATPDLLAERPLVIFGKYRGKGGGSIQVSGVSGRGKFKKNIAVSSAAPTPANAGLRYLWARQRIAELSDRVNLAGKREYAAAITNLGLQYNLLTKYTSFVAVDPRVRNTSAKNLSVKQKLPVPRGVNPRYITPDGVTVKMKPPSRDREDDDDEGRSFSGSTISERRYEQIVRTAAGVSIVQSVGSPALDERSSTISPFIANSVAISQRFRLADRGGENAFASTTQARFGFGRFVEARLQSTLFTRVAGETLDPDITGGLKLHLPVPNVALALLTDVRGTFDDTNPERLRARTALLAERWFWDFLALRLNLGGALLNLRGPDDENLFGLIYGVDLSTRRISLGGDFRLEPHVGVAGLARNNGTSQLEMGTALHIGSNWALGALLQVGLTDTTEDIAGSVFLRFTR